MNWRALKCKGPCLAAASACSVSLGACAVPATEVQVSTMSMRQALDATRATDSHAPGSIQALPSLTPSALPPGAQRPLLSTPEVRLAYLYEWVDGDNNRHFGEWVAIPVSGFHWIMSDGSRSSATLPASSNPVPVTLPSTRARAPQAAEAH